MKRKRALSLALAGLMAFSLAACSSGKENNGDTGNDAGADDVVELPWLN